MDMLYLIVSIAGQRVALPADHVESVVEIDMVTPVPLVAPHVAGLAALRSRVLTIVDTRAALELEDAAGAAQAGAGDQAVVVTVDGHLYGLLVDEVEDVVARPGGIEPLRVAPGAGWSRVARGMVEIAGDVLLLLDPAAIVAGPCALAA